MGLQEDHPEVMVASPPLSATVSDSRQQFQPFSIHNIRFKIVHVLNLNSGLTFWCYRRSDCKIQIFPVQNQQLFMRLCNIFSLLANNLGMTFVILFWVLKKWLGVKCELRNGWSVKLLLISTVTICSAVHVAGRDTLGLGGRQPI